MQCPPGCPRQAAYQG